MARPGKEERLLHKETAVFFERTASQMLCLDTLSLR